MVITMAELAYAAGIVDGEGNIGVHRKKSIVHKGGYQYMPRVTVVNTSYELMEWLKSRFGGSISIHQRGTERWRVSYKWQLANRDVPKFLAAIKPFLVIKRQQAALAIAFPKTTTFGRTIVTESVLAERERIYIAVSQLNQRGPAHVS